MCLRRGEVDGAHNSDSFDERFAVELEYEEIDGEEAAATEAAAALAAAHSPPASARPPLSHPRFRFDGAASQWQLERVSRYLRAIGAKDSRTTDTAASARFLAEGLVTSAGRLRPRVGGSAFSDPTRYQLSVRSVRETM